MTTLRQSLALLPSLCSLTLAVGCFGAVAPVQAEAVVSSLDAAQRAGTKLVDFSYDLVAPGSGSVALTSAPAVGASVTLGKGKVALSGTLQRHPLRELPVDQRSAPEDLVRLLHRRGPPYFPGRPEDLRRIERMFSGMVSANDLQQVGTDEERCEDARRKAPNLLISWWHPSSDAVRLGINSKIESIESAARGFHSFASYRTRLLFFPARFYLKPRLIYST